MARDPASRRGHEIYPDADTDLDRNNCDNNPGQSPVPKNQRICGQKKDFMVDNDPHANGV